MTANSSFGFWISWNEVSSVSVASVTSTSVRCCWRYSWALLSTLSRNSRLTRDDSFFCSPPPLCVAVTDIPSPPKVSLACMLKWVPCNALPTISPSARVVSLDSDRRVLRLSSSSLVARVFFTTDLVV